MFILASYIVVALVLAKLRVSMEGVYIYIYIYLYLSIHTHFFFLKVWGRFPCYLLHFGAKISHLHAHLAFGFWLWLHLASLGFWLLAFGFWPLASLGFWFLLVFGFCLQVVSRHRHS